MKINEISPLDNDFTEVLDTIALKPKTLFYIGKMPKKVLISGKKYRPPTVAIVGTRRNTTYGKEIAFKAAYECAQAGAIVVSGLAYGIDSIAHRGALAAGGVTLAVLGTAVDDIYPRSHTALAREIVEKGGAIISEHAPGETKTRIGMKTTFLERNRIISGLADAVLVVEAAERSGSLNTASHALEQGREVFAVPGNINQPYSRGCNKLIEMGAEVYQRPEDILDKIWPVSRKKNVKKQFFGGSPSEQKIMEQIGNGVYDGAEIIDKTGLSAAEYSQAITLLEIKRSD